MTNLMSGREYLSSLFRKDIWKPKSPKKSQVFLWILAHGNLSTFCSLQRRMPEAFLNPSWCVLCKASADDFWHIFLSCPYADFFWEQIFSYFKLNWCFPRLSGGYFSVVKCCCFSWQSEASLGQHGDSSSVKNLVWKKEDDFPRGRGAC